MSRSAYTVVEGLIVIAILTIVIAILFADAKKAKVAQPLSEWHGLSTKADYTELLVLPTGERVFVMVRGHSICAVLLPPLPVEPTQ